MKKMFIPGCALTIYKPHFAEKLLALLTPPGKVWLRLDICCINQPCLEDATQVITVCPGCDRRYRENYANTSTISLWEIACRK